MNKKIVHIAVSAAIFATAVAPSFAATTGETNGMKGTSVHAMTPAIAACRATARQTYRSSLKEAAQNYSTASKAARATLKEALKQTKGDKTARQTALSAYAASIKSARTARATARKSALSALKTARVSCATAQ